MNLLRGASKNHRPMSVILRFRSNSGVSEWRFRNLALSTVLVKLCIHSSGRFNAMLLQYCRILVQGSFAKRSQSIAAAGYALKPAVVVVLEVRQQLC